MRTISVKYYYYYYYYYYIIIIIIIIKAQIKSTTFPRQCCSEEADMTFSLFSRNHYDETE